MTAMTKIIIDFLLARIAEDEAVARRASAVTAVEWVANGSVLMHIADPGIRLAEATATVEHYRMDDAWRHAERHDPARVLAECAAKRAIIDLATSYASTVATADDLYGIPSGDPEWHDLAAINEAIRHLAAIYNDHPDYRQEWRP